MKVSPQLVLAAVECVRTAGGTIELGQLGQELELTRPELDRLLAYAEDERRRLLRVWQEATTGQNHVLLTAAGEELSKTRSRSR